MATRSASRSGPIRIALAGLGLVGRRHVEAMRARPELQLVAVVDPAAGALEEARVLGVPLYQSVPDMLASETPDGVILATPTVQHVAQAMDCVRAGVPALIEKPISDDLDAAARLVAQADQAGVALLVGHHRRYNPLVQAAQEQIRAGLLGEIRAVHATCWFYKPDSYFDEAPWRKQRGAGPISVNLVHDIDLLRHLCGEIVQVRAQSVASRRGYANEDLASALLTFESGALGTISVSDSIVSPWSWELTAKEYPVYPATGQSAYMIGGSKGALSIPDQRLWTHSGAPDWWSPISASTAPEPQADPLVVQLIHFGEVISGRAAPLVSGLEGLKSLRVVDAIQRAAQTGAVVDLPRA